VYHDLSILPHVGPARISALRSSGVATVEELVRYVPRQWIDRTRLARVRDLREGDDAILRLEVVSARLVPGRRGRLTVRAEDGTGAIDLVFFGYAESWARRLARGTRWIAAGKVGWFRGPQMVHPEMEEAREDGEWEGGILPVYPLTEAMRQARIEQRFFRKAMAAALGLSTLVLPERFPDSLRAELGWPTELENLRTLHFPRSMEEVAEARKRLCMGEVLPVAIRMARRRELMGRRGRSLTGGRELADALRKSLPFPLTAGQESVFGEILAAQEAPGQSHLLLQGDVGSGKTVVAAMACAAAIGAGVQCALMAPTELLAWQHWRKLRPLFEGISVRVGLLCGSTPPAERAETLRALAAGEIRLLVGTHALYSADVAFADLGFCVIDEQHRFGVGQRAALLAKGRDPDLLALSATPIPRSLAMTLYGDLRPVVLKEKPKGRQPVRTRLVPPEKRAGLLSWLDAEFARGNRAYWVVPRIDDDDESELQSLEALEAELRKSRPGWRIAVAHGRMPEEEKKAALGGFADGAFDLLLATTVVEVGVDVPEAGVMVIEGAARFGLAQLHQLRGRVGRGQAESWCFLLLADADRASVDRLNGFASTDDGFEIAELDLAQRGAGNLEGLAQSGAARFLWLDFVRDRDLIAQAISYAGEKLSHWETLPADQRGTFEKWCESDLLEARGNQ